MRWMVELDLNPCESDFLFSKVSDSVSFSTGGTPPGLLEMEISNQGEYSFSLAALTKLGSVSTCNALPCGSQSSCCRGRVDWESQLLPLWSTTVFLQGPSFPELLSAVTEHTGTLLQAQTAGHGTPLMGLKILSLFLPSFLSAVRPATQFSRRVPASSPLSFAGISYPVLTWCQLQTNTVSKIEVLFFFF